MCHMYSCSDKIISLPTPLYYAHLAAARGQVIDDDDDDVGEEEEGEEVSRIHRSRIINMDEKIKEKMFYI